MSLIPPLRYWCCPAISKVVQFLPQPPKCFVNLRLGGNRCASLLKARPCGDAEGGSEKAWGKSVDYVEVLIDSLHGSLPFTLPCWNSFPELRGKLREAFTLSSLPDRDRGDDRRPTLQLALGGVTRQHGVEIGFDHVVGAREHLIAAVLKMTPMTAGEQAQEITSPDAASGSTVSLGAAMVWDLRALLSMRPAPQVARVAAVTSPASRPDRDVSGFWYQKLRAPCRSDIRRSSRTEATNFRTGSNRNRPSGGQAMAGNAPYTRAHIRASLIAVPFRRGLLTEARA